MKKQSETFIIAEAGVNHNGDIEFAKRMIEVAADAGVDCVKFQTFKAKALATRFAGKAEYQKLSTAGGDNQQAMLESLELREKDYPVLISHCRKNNVQFLSSAFDLGSLRFLHTLRPSLYKVPSGEITNLPYLRQLAGYGKPILLSTGMCTVREIDDAIETLCRFGLERKLITLLHCNTDYPTPFKDVNLSAMGQLRRIFGVDVGYSDHTVGIEIPIAAVAQGAKVVEKHFTLDRKMPGPDHKASLEAGELKEMVKAIRNVWQALGDGFKRPTPSELKNKVAARKSIVAKVSIKKGEQFTERNIDAKRPGGGISPMEWENVLGRRATRGFQQDEAIEI